MIHEHDPSRHGCEVERLLACAPSATSPTTVTVKPAWPSVNPTSAASAINPAAASVLRLLLSQTTSVRALKNLRAERADLAASGWLVADVTEACEALVEPKLACKVHLVRARRALPLPPRRRRRARRRAA